MSKARLLSLTLERFKSYRDPTTIEFAPLTILLGRNNSGKSSIIQALLLLKQTLMQPRTDVPLHLEGPYVDALSLRELTFGWPEKGQSVKGPAFSLSWETPVEKLPKGKQYARASIYLEYASTKKSPLILQKNLFEMKIGSQVHTIAGGGRGRAEQFFPHYSRGGEISIERAFQYGQLMGVFSALIKQLGYLSSARIPPPTIFRSATVPPEELGINGEYAAQLIQSRRSAKVHYLPPIWLSERPMLLPTQIKSRSLVDAVNSILQILGVNETLTVEDIGDFGFRLLFGQASLQHVGRGLNYLLPVVLLGLLADPLKFNKDLEDKSLKGYLESIQSVPICALEEPEIHLHPKVQSRLAHWFVALAMAGRQLIVETHSDHLVRRLRGLVAKAQPGSDAEKWLLENVRILDVTQDKEGCSHIRTLHLTPQGGIEEWPADFMDEATQEEQSIYFASLDKPAAVAEAPPEASAGEIEHDVGEEPDTPE